MGKDRPRRARYRIVQSGTKTAGFLGILDARGSDAVNLRRLINPDISAEFLKEFVVAKASKKSPKKNKKAKKVRKAAASRVTKKAAAKKRASKGKGAAKKAKKTAKKESPEEEQEGEEGSQSRCLARHQEGRSEEARFQGQGCRQEGEEDRQE